MKKLYLCFLVSMLSFSPAANACYIWLTDGYGEQSSNVITYYEGYSIGIYVTGCTFTSPFAAAHLYVVPNDLAANENSLNGTTLVDVNGQPNTLASFISCGYVQDELIASTATLGIGEFDILIDRNMNGVFDAGVDCFLNPGADFTFKIIPAVVTNYNTNTGGGDDTNFDWGFGTDNLVNQIKSDAAIEAQELQDLHDKYDKMGYALFALEFGTGALVNHLYSVNRLSSFRPGGVMMGQWAGADAATIGTPFGYFASQAADVALYNAKARYNAIAADPPRFDYDELAAIDSLDMNFDNVFNDSLSLFINALENLTQLEVRALAADLLSLERLQGATIDSNRVGGYMQSLNLLHLNRLKQQIKIAKLTKWQMLREYAVAHNVVGAIPTDVYGAIKEDLMNNGFDQVHQDYFQAMSYTPAEIETVRNAIINSSIQQYAGKTYLQLMDEIISTENESLELLQTAHDSLVVMVNLFEGISPVLPVVPDFEITGASVVVGQNHATPGPAVSLQYHDIDNIGTSIQNHQYYAYRNDQFISNPVFNYVPMYPGYDLVRHSVVLANGLLAISYHLMEITPGIVSPKIISSTPAEFLLQPETQDEPINFRVNGVTVPVGFTPTYEWFVNGIPYASNVDSLVFTPLSCTKGVFEVRVIVSDNAQGNFRDVREWQIRVDANPELCTNTPSRKNSTHWYFGAQAGIRFGGPAPVALTNSAMTQVEGVATMSDSTGQLLFYTNGITVFNRNHQVMVNGTGLTSHSSNTQAAMIIPYPGKPDKYFIITPDPYYYSVVDMTLDNGNGAIISDQKNMLITNERSEKVTAVYAANQRDIWLITCAQVQKRFNVYLVNENGLSALPIVSQFDDPIFSGYYGYMKASPNGNNLVTADFTQHFHLFDFNTQTGVVSNKRRIVPPTSIGGFGTYGIEFSPNGKLVYTADHRGLNRVYQFNISLGDVDLIQYSMVSLQNSPAALGALQLGPDGKIYVAKENGYLGVIHNPNQLGTECNYVYDGLFLNGRQSYLGLPGFISSTLIQNEIEYDGHCAGHPITFSLDRELSPNDTVYWNFGDILSSSNEAEGPVAMHVYAAAGVYDVQCIILYDTLGGGFSDTLYTQIEVLSSSYVLSEILYFDPNPSCRDSIMLSASTFGDGYQWYYNNEAIDGATQMSLYVAETGSYSLEIGSINGCSLAANDQVEINFWEGEVQPTIALINPTQLGTQTYNSYQWYLNDEPLNGETAQTVTLDAFGTYHVEVTNADGCVGVSGDYVHIDNLVEVMSNARIQLYPNPVSTNLTVANVEAGSHVSIYDITGKLVYQSITTGTKCIINTTALAVGLYQLQIEHQDSVIRKKFVVSK
jgi:hypothetical protein